MGGITQEVNYVDLDPHVAGDEDWCQRGNPSRGQQQIRTANLKSCQWSTEPETKGWRSEQRASDKEEGKKAGVRTVGHEAATGQLNKRPAIGQQHRRPATAQ